MFHGADSDIEWLQRDLSIYVVNMFDTHQAAKRLGLARLSLAFLIKHYCDLELDKTFQLADWRIRPLPEELILYARLDTHYLLYVWDAMKMDLLKLANERTNLLESVFQSSGNICKKVCRFQSIWSIEKFVTNFVFVTAIHKTKNQKWLVHGLLSQNLKSLRQSTIVCIGCHFCMAW